MSASLTRLQARHQCKGNLKKKNRLPGFPFPGSAQPSDSHFVPLCRTRGKPRTGLPAAQRVFTGVYFVVTIRALFLALLSNVGLSASVPFFSLCLFFFVAGCTRTTVAMGQLECFFLFSTKTLKSFSLFNFPPVPREREKKKTW